MNGFGQNIPQIGKRVDLGVIEHPDLVEASGLVESLANEHVFWAHNDRNNQNRLFAFNEAGQHLGIFYLDTIANRDWEGLAIGPGPIDQTDYLYIGDIGDNEAVFDVKYIYRVPEPDVSFDQSPVEETLSGIDTISYRYPDGSRDAETLMIDPQTGDIYVVSKREFEDIRVYRAPYPQSTSEVITLEHVSTLDLWQIVGGDISTSGKEILLKSYTEVYYWKRPATGNLWEAFNDPPTLLPYIEEIQGEAICWAADSLGYYTLSEENSQIPAHLYFYPRLSQHSIIITEIMKDPAAVSDNLGEWFEIYNNSDETIELHNWIIRDNKSDYHTIAESITILPGEYLVLGANADTATNGHLSINYVYSDFVLDNVDEIILASPLGATIDSVSYDAGELFPGTEGFALALLDFNLDNSFGLYWRNAIQTYGNGDYGSPGWSNLEQIQQVSIKDIQFTTDPEGQSPLTGKRVQITGVVTTTPFSFLNQWFFIQDTAAMWSGILAKKQLNALAQGDLVELTGMVAEANGKLTMLIDISDLTVLAKDIATEAVMVTTGEINTFGANAEAWESVLIQVTGVCDNDNVAFREWSIDDGTGSARVYTVLIDGFTPVFDQEYTVRGVQYFSNNEFKILPRDASYITDPLAGLESNRLYPKKFVLWQNYPNPFNPTTAIRYRLSAVSLVELSIYNVLGEKVAVLVKDKQPSGLYTVNWNASGFAAGIYFYKLQTDAGFVQTRKLLLLK
jgi:hypothetical protein